MAQRARYLLSLLASGALLCVSAAAVAQGTPGAADHGALEARLAWADAAAFSGDHERALWTYDAIALQDVNGAVAPAALRRAAIASEALGRLGDAIDRHEALLIRFPQHRMVATSVWSMAELSARLHDHEAAAAHYLAFHDRFATLETPPELAALGYSYSARATRALRRGARSLALLHQHAEAGTRYDQLARALPDGLERADAAWRAFEAYVAAERYGDAKRVFVALTHMEVDDLDHHARMHRALITRGHKMLSPQGWEEARRAHHDAIARRFIDGERSLHTPAARAMACAGLERADHAMRQWKALEITGPLAARKRALDTLTAGLFNVTHHYEVLFVHEDPEFRIVAYYRLAERQEHYADTPVRALPQGNAPTWTAFHDELLALSDEALEEATTRHERLLRYAEYHGIRNEWVRASEARLARLEGRRAPPPPAPFDLADQRVHHPDFVTSRDLD